MSFFKNKKVIVTGGAGFIGANLVRRLVQEGADVHLFVREKTVTKRIADVLDSLTLHTVDLADHEHAATVLERIAPDGVFHLAASNQSFVDRPTLETMVATNVTATLHFMEAASRVPLSFFVNTGTFVEVGAKPKPLSEDDVLEPIEFYAISKVPATLYCRALGKYQNKPFVEVRAFTPYGPWMQPGKIMYAVITKALRGEPLTLTRPEVSRDYIFVDDLVELYLAVAAEARSHKGEVFNGGSGIATTLQEVADVVREETGSQSEVVWGNQNIAFDNAHWEADLSVVSAAFGWKPEQSFREGVKKTVQWFRDHESYWLAKP